jgi:hypothetical protein
MKLELFTLPQHLSSPLVFSGVRVTRSLVLCVCWFSLGPPVYPTNKADHHDITELLLKVAIDTIKQTNNFTWAFQKGSPRHSRDSNSQHQW